MGGILGMSYSFMIRHQLGQSSLKMSGHMYNTIVTAHALIIIFFIVIPTLIGGFGNYLIPVQIGIPDLIFPRLNCLSVRLIPCGLILLLTGVYVEGGSGTSWTYYPPLSSDGHFGIAVDFSIIRLHVAGISSMVASFNFISSILKGKGSITLESVLLFCWTLIVTSFLLILSLPVLACGLTMLLLDRNDNSCFFDSSGGGNSLLYQHLFWFFGHPEVYILILPAFGLVSHATIILSGKDSVDSYLGIIYSVLSIGLVGCVVWAHHIYVTGIDADSRAYFTAATIVIAIPTGIKVYTWLLTMSESHIKSNPVRSWVFGFLFMFTIGGASGVVLSNAIIDVNLHDTYFVTAHFHYVLSIGAVFGIFTGISIYWPVVRKLSYDYSMIQGFFNSFFVSVNLTFFPIHFLGLQGCPRKYKQIPDKYRYLVRLSSLGSLLAIISFWFFIVIYINSMVRYRIIFFINSFTSRTELRVEHQSHSYMSGFCIFTNK